MDNFIVGLSNATPSLNTVIRGRYPICGVYPGPVPSNSKSSSVRCSPGSLPARHVIIQQPETGLGYINFCEVEVWTKHTSMNITLCCLFDENTNLSKSTLLNYNKCKKNA